MTEMEMRAVEEAEYLLAKGTTVRGTAEHLALSKSTVHKDLVTHLRDSRPDLYEEVRRLLDRNKAERHLRGGEATKVKYSSLRKRKENLSAENK